MSMLKPVFWISLLAAAGIYVTMIAWSLPAITAAAGGLTPFDLRPLGYDFAEAQAFLRALSDPGRQLYLEVQQRLDIAYPALLMLALGLGIALVCPPRFGNWKWTLALTSVPGSLFDYRENLLVRRILTSPPDALDPALVAAASGATVLKSALSAISMSVLLVLCILWVLGKRHGASTRTQT
jgi:hypothetical protein